MATIDQQTIYIEMNSPNDLILVHAVQGEYYSRQIHANLRVHGSPFTVPDGMIALVRYRRPDGSVGFYDFDPVGNRIVTIGSPRTYIDVILSSDICSVPGRVKAHIDLYSTSTGERASSFFFYIDVEKAPTDPEIYKETNVSGVQELLTEILENVYTPGDPSTGVIVDNTLSIPGAVGDSKAMGDVVLVQPEQPTSGEPTNKIWIDSDSFSEGTEIPEMTEFWNLARSIANPYSSESTYAVGDCVLHDFKLYRCTTAIEYPENWNGSHWIRISTDSELNLKGLSYIPTHDSFVISDMPAGSYTYIKASRLVDPPADDLGSGSYCSIIGFPSQSPMTTRTVTLFLFYSSIGDRLFYGHRIFADSITWTEVVNNATEVKEISNSVAQDSSTNILTRPYCVHHSNYVYNGITYDYNQNGIWHISGAIEESYDLSFANILSSTLAFSETDLRPGDRIQVKITGNPDEIGLRVYLYPSSLPQRNIRYISDGVFTIPDGCTGMLVRLEVNGENTNLFDGYDVQVGLYTCPTHDDVAEHYKSTKELKLLVLGSSFSYSTLGYLPAMMASIDPDVKITMGICYDSGQTVAGHINRFDNNTVYTTYSEYVPSSKIWTRWSSEFTSKQVLERFKWDYIVIQQACRHTTNSIYEVEELASKIQNYISYNTCFLFNMAQVLGANNDFPERYTQPTGEAKSNAMFAEMANYASQLASGYIITDILPCGTAVQNARTSSLKTLGTASEQYLCYDNNGHLCNGLPIMIGTIAACYKLLSIIGRKSKIWGNTFIPTEAWRIQDNIPMSVTSYGPCIGITQSNILLAKKCALAAIKDPFHITDFSLY